MKKVELPAFDKKIIHIGFAALEPYSADRAGAKDKFFFIETKLDVNLNPKINKFLCGASKGDQWDEFLQYLITFSGAPKRLKNCRLVFDHPHGAYDATYCRGV